MAKFTPRQRAYIRKRTKEAHVDPSELVGELNIVPFLDIVVNLIMFLLATTEAVLLISQIESDLPKIARGQSRPSEVATPLNLNVTVTDNGVIVSGSGGKLAPGCSTIDQGRAVTVPKKGKDYDWPALTDCAVRVKSLYQSEHSVTVSADPQVVYEHVVAAMDAVRSKGKDPLFPDVLISVGVR
ncbi:MAG TPA: biopolymer transporter ExbD [Polyangiales bacterium]|nr:biopolymer transporter ExbD [Polyangiales bacterium]